MKRLYGAYLDKCHYFQGVLLQKMSGYAVISLGAHMTRLLEEQALLFTFLCPNLAN